MGLIGTVLDFLRTSTPDAGDPKVSDVTLDPGASANQTAHHYQGAGVDAVPLPGDFAVTVSGPASGELIVVGYVDPKNAGTAEAGEFRIYSRDGNGAVKATIHLKADGAVSVENENANLEITPAGDISGTNSNGSFALEAGGIFRVNGASIDTDGNITSPGSVSAVADVIANALSVPARVTLLAHVHPTAAVGSPSPPTPGT